MSGKNPSLRNKAKNIAGALDAGKRRAGEDTEVMALDESVEQAPLTMSRAEMPTEEGTISRDIDGILKRLDEGMPRLNARLDQLLGRQRQPLTAA